MVLTREKIRDRVRVYQATLSDERVNLFAAAVPERKIRNVIWIGIMGDGTARTVEIEKTEENDDHTMKFNNIPVPPADLVTIPEGWHFDIENPFMTLEGGTNLTGIASGVTPAPEVTIIYWDTPAI